MLNELPVTLPREVQALIVNKVGSRIRGVENPPRLITTRALFAARPVFEFNAGENTFSIGMCLSEMLKKNIARAYLNGPGFVITAYQTRFTEIGHRDIGGHLYICRYRTQGYGHKPSSTPSSTFIIPRLQLRELMSIDRDLYRKVLKNPDMTNMLKMLNVFCDRVCRIANPTTEWSKYYVFKQDGLFMLKPKAFGSMHTGYTFAPTMKHQTNRVRSMVNLPLMSKKNINQRITNRANRVRQNALLPLKYSRKW